MSSSPYIGLQAVVLKGTEVIAHIQGYDLNVETDLIKAYEAGSDKPAVLESGMKTFRISIRKMACDSAYLSDLLNGTKLTIEVRPQGTGSGKPKITIQNVVFRAWRQEMRPNAVILENVEGEGTNAVPGSQT